MKKIILGLVGTALTLTAITSCKDLDLKPNDAIDVEVGFQTYLDARFWDAGLHTQLKSRQYGTFLTLQEQQADYLNASLDFGNRGGALHRWGNFLQANDVAGPYQSYYSGIANANKVIEGLDRITVNAGAQTDSLNTYKADARAVRAFYYHELMTRYSKPYNPATATTDLGVPLITTYDVKNIYPARATAKVVYDQVLADIAFARANTKRPNRVAVANQAPRASAFLTPDALLALEARVKLATQDWAGAYTAANTVIATNRYPLYTNASDLRSYWYAEDYRQEDIMRANSSLSEVPNTNAIFLGYVPAGLYYVPDFIPTQAVVDSYEANDIRKTIYFSQFQILIQGVRYNNVWLVNKYPGATSLRDSPTAPTNYRHSPKIFRIGELYTIAAEAADRANNPTGALAALNALRVARGLTVTAAVGTALTQEIRAERTRELAFEGFRLWDLKRWGLGFSRGTPQNTVFINNGTGFSGLTVAAGDNKYTWGLPTNDLQLNPSLVPNPGW